MPGFSTSGPGNRSSQQGFTLLEVLLAFVVFAMSFAVVLEIISGSMRNTVRARQYTEVALIAQSVMDQVGLGIPLESGLGSSGEEGEYYWELDISPFEGTGDNAHSMELEELTGIELLEVELVISWGEYPREKSNSFSTIKAVLTEFRGPGS
jgi:general secretion pathway protein I